MKPLNFTIAAMALAISSAAAAENLISFGEDVDGSVHYFDVDTIKKVSDGYINVWGIIDSSKDKTVKWRTQKILLNIDCAGMKYEALYHAKYDANGRVMDSGPLDESLKPAIPGTSGYRLVEAVCARYQ